MTAIPAILEARALGKRYGRKEIETGIFLALSGLLAGFCAWWLRRRAA
ncbi:hypothetical protein ACFV30_06290 [Streptomyces sp. NPDC059752]